MAEMSCAGREHIVEPIENRRTLKTRKEGTKKEGGGTLEALEFFSRRLWEVWSERKVRVSL